MARRKSADNAAFRRFLHRVWRQDVEPLLRDQRAKERRTTARATGKAAAAAGLLADSLLGLRGRPFTRFMAVVGGRLGALLPDAWDWSWLGEQASTAQQELVSDRVSRRAAELPEREALALFGLPASARREELKRAWRGVLQRWHPDKAPDEARRAEYHVRFLTYKTSYDRLCQAYDEGRLPVREAAQVRRRPR